MKTSVAIIAHNEENYIAQCIESLLSQTQKPDEVILVVHNSTDRTEEIARTYPITVLPYTGLRGIIYARLEVLKYVTGDIILCIDGDSYAAPNWVETMKNLLRNGNHILVGSWITYTGSLFGWISNIFNWFHYTKHFKDPANWIWGPSMAFWGRDKDLVIDIFTKSISLSQSLGLTRNPDDFWLALFMAQRGTLRLTNSTHVTQHTKETTSLQAIKRNIENNQNARKMRLFFKEQREVL